MCCIMCFQLQSVAQNLLHLANARADGQIDVLITNVDNHPSNDAALHLDSKTSLESNSSNKWKVNEG